MGFGSRLCDILRFYCSVSSCSFACGTGLLDILARKVSGRLAECRCAGIDCPGIVRSSVDAVRQAHQRYVIDVIYESSYSTCTGILHAHKTTLDFGQRYI
jgi:hypothetical protein